jgi:hypothetical protein
MRKLALLFAAALFVSVPLIAATPSITYAAAAKKKASGKGSAETTRSARRGGGEGGEAGGGSGRGGEDLNEVNSRFWRAINDLAISLSKPWPTAADQSGGGSGGGSARPSKARTAKRAGS